MNQPHTIEDEAREAFNAGLAVRGPERRKSREWDARLVASVRVMLRSYDYWSNQERHTEYASGNFLGVRYCLAAIVGIFGISTTDPNWVEHLRNVVSR